MEGKASEPCFETPKVAKRQDDDVDERIRTLTRERDEMTRDCIEPSARLVITPDSDAAPETPESQLVEAVIRIANCFLRFPTVHNALTEVGVSAEVLNKNRIKVIFKDPYTYDSFANDKNKYAYAWIDPKKYDGFTIILDSNFLTRYTKVWRTPGKKAESERNRIELFLALKLAGHELGHLGYRWTNPELLQPPWNCTPPDVFGGESGRHAERLSFGGELGIYHRSPKLWVGTQRVVGIHMDHKRVRDDYIERVCSECRLDAPKYSSLLPVRLCSASYPTRGDYALSTPSDPPPAEDGAFDPDEPGLCEDGSFMIDGSLCGVRLLPRPVALDFAAGGARGFGPWAFRLRPRHAAALKPAASPPH